MLYTEPTEEQKTNIQNTIITDTQRHFHNTDTLSLKYKYAKMIGKTNVQIPPKKEKPMIAVQYGNKTATVVVIATNKNRVQTYQNKEYLILRNYYFYRRFTNFYSIAIKSVVRYFQFKNKVCMKINVLVIVANHTGQDSDIKMFPDTDVPNTQQPVTDTITYNIMMKVCAESIPFRTDTKSRVVDVDVGQISIVAYKF
eukprot:TRINITY_DN244_c0_g2_i2.p3 TRINITY_DN244_c0_g2~~TRINITY_DN244_c0_g2_i2.p3  ORF type:complete len:198 (-),score=2.34 TRINITY_DN244_c0_g2_i2:1831-2424(-)